MAYRARWMVLGLLLAPGLASAKERKKAEGIPIRVVVSDDQGRPIPTAVVRHALEAERHPVNSVDGSWAASTLYLPDGTELRFAARQALELEISAPGYVTQLLAYQIRGRRNVVEVVLPEIGSDDAAVDEPQVGFGRDEPREPLVSP